ncbi:MAG: CHAD domain-containing protein [Pseudomonadota bacterium]
MKTRHRSRQHSPAHGKHRQVVPRSIPAGAAELEIRFEVPEGAWEALAQEMSGFDTHALALHATYADTPGRDLARAGVALRVRLEGDRRVQTLKSPGANALERLEDEVALGRAHDDQPWPAPDLNRHQSAAVQHVMRAALGLGSGEPLPAVAPVFEVKVRRRVRRIAHGTSVIELALDDGLLLASGRRRPIRELELELVEGNTRDLVALARRWRERWGLWVRMTSKAVRGDSLASGGIAGPPVAAAVPRVTRKQDTSEFTAAVLRACLDQVMGNASEVAAGSAADDHIHQLRVGLRRLRTALRELPALASEGERFEPVLVTVFRGLGERRDRTHVLRRIQPLVEAAGGMPLRVPPDFDEGVDPVDLVRRGDFQDAMLGLLERAQEVRSDPRQPVRRTVRAHLQKLHDQVTREGRHFTRLSEERQHRVRKRLKRLRYLSEFVAPLYSAESVRHYLAGVKPAQEALGDYNDEVMAQSLYEELVGSDPGAQFGVDWLRSRRGEQAKVCRATLRKLQSHRPFWAKRCGGS